MNFLENITFRRNRTESVLSEESNISLTQQNETANSLPELSDDEVVEIQKLRKRIESLEAQLNLAHTEIEALSLQNNELKRCNDDLKTKKKKSTLKSNQSTPVKKGNTPKNKSKSGQKYAEENTLLEEHKLEQKQDKKVCLLSTNKENNILAIAENYLGQHSKICHYLMPGSSLRELLTGIKEKLTGFTMNDFCIILIGEEEFRSTHDYFSIITYMRDILNEIRHTNIIVCLPTYKYGEWKDMYNWRVENFNNLLYLDVTTHEHAYLFDSNKKLRYDYTMFNRRSGKINNFGMRNVFNNLGNYMQTFQKYNKVDHRKLQNSLDDTEEESTFFRD